MSDSEQQSDPPDEITHDVVEEHLAEDMEWPQYFVSGEDVDVEDFAAAYYRVEGPNGPVSYINPGREPQPTTMYDLAMEAQADSFRWCEREETPWEEYEDDN